MSNYVQHMWESQTVGDTVHAGRTARVVAWIVGAIAVLSLVAYASQDYWYSYVSSYL